MMTLAGWLFSVLFGIWTTPRTWVPGELVTAGIMNTHVRDQLNILKIAVNDSGHLSFTNATELTISGGVVTITQNFHTLDTESDASTDDLDTMTPGANVVAGHVLFVKPANAARTVVVKDGVDNIDVGADVSLEETHTTYAFVWDGTSWLPFSFVAVVQAIQTYLATLSDVANTTTPTNAIAWSVAANEMADGDMIEVHYTVLIKNDKGTAGGVTYKQVWGGGSTTLHSAVSWADNASERAHTFRYWMQRAGADLYVFNDDRFQTIDIVTTGSADTALKIASATFGSGVTAALEITLDDTDVTFYFNVQSASVRRIQAAAS